MKPILTIHTATYNRAYILEKAYRSLQKQTEMNFEWLITDDGSTDGTEELVDGWIKEQNPFNIRYIKLEHQGLIRAVNYAISVANGKYYFRLDSDDYLRYDAVEQIVKRLNEIDDKEEFVAVGFVKVTEDGEPLKGVWPNVNKKGFVDCTNLERKNIIWMQICVKHIKRILCVNINFLFGRGNYLRRSSYNLINWLCLDIKFDGTMKEFIFANIKTLD